MKRPRILAIRSLLLLGGFLLISCFGWGQENKAEPFFNLSSPRSTVTTFVKNMQEASYHPEVAGKTFSPESELNKNERKELAIKLKQIIDGAGIIINMEEVPTSPNYFDTTQNQAKFTVSDRYPQLYLIKERNHWYFSQHTVQAIPEIHQEIYPFGVDKLLDVLPKLGTKKFLGLHIWQYLALLILIFMSVIIHKVLTLFFNKLIYTTLRYLGYRQVAKKYVLPVARPFSILMVIIFFIIFLPVVQLPIRFSHYTIILLKAAIPVVGTMICYKIVDIIGAYMQRYAKRTENTMDDQIVPLVKRVLKIFVVVVGILFTLDNLQFDITALLAGISIGGLAFALAAQETIKNFFGSIMIIFDKPFQIGDWITAGDIDGTVEEVGFRSTRIRTFRNSLISVPNGKLADMTIDNNGLRKYRRFYTTITITYDTPPNLIESFVKGLRNIVANHPHTWKDFYQIHFNDFGNSSLNIMFYIFFSVPTWDEELACRQEVLLEIVRLAEHLGVRFAFPTQTLHMENFPEKKSLSPQYPSEEEIQKALAGYQATKQKQQ